MLRGELGDAEQADLEQLIAQDAELAEAVKAYREAYEILDETSWKLTGFKPELKRAKDYLAFYTDEKNKQYYNELKNINLNQKQNKMSKTTIFGAIGVAAAIVLAVVFLNKGGADTDYGSVYDQYASLDEIPTFTVRGATDSVLSLIETQFYAKQFADVNTIINENEEAFDDDQKSLVSIYQGVSYGERGMYEEAYEVLSKRELFENSLYDQMAEWYLALALLNGETSARRAVEMFKEIAGDDTHYKQAEAKQILKKL